MSYEAGTAFLQVVPSLAGAVKDISAQATELGEQAGRLFEEAFEQVVEGASPQIGPSDEDSVREGDSSGGKFADAFKARVTAALKDLPDASVGLDPTDADLAIDDIRTRLETLRNLKIGVDISDFDALAAIDVLKAECDELAAKSPSIRVRVDAASASAELAAIRTEADGVSGADGSGGGFAGILSSAGESSFSLTSVLLPALAAVLLAMIPVAGIAAAIGIGFLGMATAAGAAFGAFGLAVLPIASQVTTALSTIASDQKAVNDATSAATKNTAITKLNDDLNALSPVVRDITFGVLLAKQAFTDWDNQFDPAIIQVFNSALSVMEPFLNAITPLVFAGASGLEFFFQSMAKVAGSTAFTSFITFLAQQAGPAIFTLVSAFEGFGSIFASALEQSGPLIADVESGLLGVIGALAKWVEGGGFQTFLAWVQKNGPSIVSDIASFVSGFGSILVALAPVGGAILTVAGGFGQFLGWLSKTPAALIGVSIALGILGIALAVALDSNPVGLIITAIGLLIIGVVELVAHWTTVWGQIKSVFDQVTSFLRSGLGTLVILLTGPIAPLLLLALHWQQVWGAIRPVVEPVINFIKNDVIAPLVGFFQTTIPVAIGVFQAIWSAIWPVISTALSVAWDIMKVIFEAIEIVAIIPLGLAVLAFKAIWALVWPIISDALKTAWSILQPIFNFIKTLGLDILSTDVAALQAAWSLAWGIIGPVVSAVWSVMSPVFGFIKTLGLDLLTNAVNGLKDAWSAVFGALSGFVSAAWDDIKPILNDIIQGINDVINAYNSIPLAPNIKDIPLIGSGPQTASQLGFTPETGHAAGGYIPPNEWSIVGEKGPEPFWSGAAGGFMLPNSAAKALGTVDLRGMGSPGPTHKTGISIGQAVFKDEADLDVLTRKSNFAFMSGQL